MAGVLFRFSLTASIVLIVPRLLRVIGGECMYCKHNKYPTRIATSQEQHLSLLRHYLPYISL